MSKFFKFVLANLDKDWDWGELSSNPEISFSDIKNNPTLPWSSDDVIENPNVSIDEYLVLYPDRSTDWETLSMNPGLTTLDLLRYVNLGMVDSDAISNNTNVTLEFVLAYQHTLPWDWYCLSLNKNITITDVVSHPELSWNWWWVSQKPGITIELLRAYRNLPWDWGRVSAYARATVTDMINSPDIPWVYRCVSENPNVTIADVKCNSSLWWNWLELLRNPGITVEDILETPELPWPTKRRIRFEWLSRNPNVTIEYVMDTIDCCYKYWSFQGLSFNEGVSLDAIYANPTLPWDYYAMSSRHRPSVATPTEARSRHETKWTSLRAELETMPAGRHRALPDGGVEFHRQMSRLQELVY